MLKLAAIVGVVILVIVAGILIHAATKPNDFRVERSLVIKAPADRIHALIADFHAWASWSPTSAGSGCSCSSCCPDT